MSNLMQAAEILRREATRYEGLVAAAAALEAMGSLKNAEADAQRATKVAQDELQAAKDAVAAAKEELERVTIDARVVEGNATSQAKSIVEAAKEAADALRTENDRVIAAQLTNAKAQADKTVAGAKMIVESFTAERNTVYAETIKLQAEMEAKREELAALEAKIEAAKDAMRKMLGQ